MAYDLSIIIASYNTKDITHACITFLHNALTTQNAELKCEILVVDNASSDGSQETLKKLPVKTILLQENVGFSKANNIALAEAKGQYVLFLNSDVYVTDVNFIELCAFLDKNKQRGALTVRVNLESGAIDKASHRGFPTLWNSLTYYTGLERLASRIPFLRSIFGGYHLLQKDMSMIHEVDAISGAFFLVKKSVLDVIGGFDEAFFMYGEDIDLAYRIKQAGYSIYYYPRYTVLHLKYKSGIGTANSQTKQAISYHFYDAMRIFYAKHYEKNHLSIINALVYAVITFQSRRV